MERNIAVGTSTANTEIVFFLQNYAYKICESKEKNLQIDFLQSKTLKRCANCNNTDRN